MGERICPACEEPLPIGAVAPAFCPACGYNLASAPAPPGWVIGGVDLRTVARRQRRLLWYVIPVFLVVPLALVPRVAFTPMTAFLVRALTFTLITLIALGAGGVLIALRSYVALCLWVLFLLVLPEFGLLPLLFANQMAFRALRHAGLHAGLLGVSDETVVRHLGYCRCRRCGYSLIGNVSGVCPECGTPTEAAPPPRPP